MTDFAGNEALLRDFLAEAAERLAALDHRLVCLEQSPADSALLDAVFRDFHTLKGGAGFLGASELVRLCHLSENVLDLVRNARLPLDPPVMGHILDATAAVRTMLDALSDEKLPLPAPPGLLRALASTAAPESARPVPDPAVPASPCAATTAPRSASSPDWQTLFEAVGGSSPPPTATSPSARTPPPYPAHGGRSSDDPAAGDGRVGRRATDDILAGKESAIRVDAARLDQVVNLAGAIGITRNRLSCLRGALLAGKDGTDALRALDETISELDAQVTDLQNAVMKTRMEPVGRLFERYHRLVRDFARQLGKEADLRLCGESTEIDRMMSTVLSEALIHLVRNALDHGIEPPEERRAAGKTERGVLALSARQSGDTIVIEVSDDGRGMQAQSLRRKAIVKKLVDADAVDAMDDRQALNLILLPGFSTKDEVSDVSGRGVGMDVVRTNVQKLSGRIEIDSEPGAGTTITIMFPLTLAILPVLVVRSNAQLFALPLAQVRAVVRLSSDNVAYVSGRAATTIRDQALPVRSLAALLGMAGESLSDYGVLLQTATAEIVLAVDGFAGRDDVVVKPIEGSKPKGISGATRAAEGDVILVLDIEELLADLRIGTAGSLSVQAA